MERAGTAHPQPVEILEHVARCPRRTTRGPNAKDSRAARTRREPGGPRPRTPIRQRDRAETGVVPQAAARAKTRSGRKTIAIRFSGNFAPKTTCCAWTAAHRHDEDRKKREKNASAGLRPHEPVSREGRERGKSGPQRRQRRSDERGREAEHRDPDDGADRVVPEPDGSSEVERAGAPQEHDDGHSRREEKERGCNDRDALPRGPTQPPLRPRPGESDEPQHGERRGDGREHVQDDELCQNTADEKPVTRGLFPQGNLLGLERAHGIQESGRHETEGEPVATSEAEELEKKGVPVQEREPGESHALSRDARQEAPGRDEKDRMRDQVRNDAARTGFARRPPGTPPQGAS